VNTEGKRGTDQMRRKPLGVKLLVCTALLAVASAGCDADNPCPVYMTNHSSYRLLITLSQGKNMYEPNLEDYWLNPKDSLFVDYYPRGTGLWIWGAYAAVASDTSCFGDYPIRVTITGKTVFYFHSDSTGAPTMSVIQ
jgi:hypothetical protein